MKIHAKRIRYQFGRPLRVGKQDFQIKGYFANRMASDFEHEPNLIAVLERLFAERQGTFVDVGANVGQTLLKVLAVDPARPYVGFEPQIGCCFFIQQFITVNELSNAKIIPVGLSNTNGICTLFFHSAFDEMASIASPIDTAGRERQKTTVIPTRIGDEILQELGLHDIAVLKIDVEGAELQVLEGLKRTLSHAKPFIIFEVMPNFYGEQRMMRDETTCEKNRAEAQRIFSFLTQCGYRMFQIDEAGHEWPIQRFNLDDPERFVGFNYIARPAA